MELNDEPINNDVIHGSSRTQKSRERNLVNRLHHDNYLGKPALARGSYDENVIARFGKKQQLKVTFNFSFRRNH